MLPFLTRLDRQPGEPLRAGLRRAVVAAVADGQLHPGDSLPPSRALARQLGIARNTVAAVYEDLVGRGVLTSVARRGVFVTDRPVVGDGDGPQAASHVDWPARFKIAPTRQRNIFRATDWQTYPYPFVYGQVDPTLFPLADWRDCSRAALARAAVNWWSADRVSMDDPLLIEQIRRHILPPRGLYAQEDEILITLGAQHAMYLLARLLMDQGTVVAVEDPGYPDVRNIAALARADVRLVPVDADGIVVGAELDPAQIAVVSPNHQSPTMVTMPEARRSALLDWARARDAVIIEDDYERDMPAIGNAMPALAARDSGRVLYMGTFSKILAPGMRLGFLVAPAAVIAEARALRRLMNRNVPLNNQRTAALFIAEGHYEGLVRRLGTAIGERRAVLNAAIARHLPRFTPGPAQGGTCVWLQCPDGVAGPDLVTAARRHGVIIERGDFFFSDVARGAPFVRLGLSSIPAERVDAGIARLATAVSDLARS